MHQTKRLFQHRYTARSLFAGILIAGLFAGCHPGSSGTTSGDAQSAAEAVKAATPYDFADGCYAVASLANQQLLLAKSSCYEASAPGVAEGTPFFMKAAALGTYIFYDYDGRYLTVDKKGAVTRSETLSPSVQWTLQPKGDGIFALQSVTAGKSLAVSGRSLVLQDAVDTACLFRFVGTRGCREFPEAKLNIDLPGKDGQSVAPLDALARPAVGEHIIGYADTHGHLNHFLGSGQTTFVGETFNPLGIQEALKDCKELHGPDGVYDLFGFAVDGHAKHATAGYPDFTFWPTAYTTTHQQAYYKWLERSWLAGQRVLVQQMVSNEILAILKGGLPPYKKAPSDDMEIAELQIQNVYAMQDYIDAQCGGPGKGWFRICTSAKEARQVISHGKMAVFLALEFDTVFGADKDYIGLYEAGKITKTQMEAKLDDIRRQLDAYHAKGVRSIFPIHAFNNGFGGAQLYQSPIFNLVNWAMRGSFYQVEISPNPRVTYHEMGIGYTDQEYADLLYSLSFLLPFVPENCTGHSNVLGLSKTGAWFLDELMRRHIVVEIDHMSDRMFNAALDILWDAKYPGLIASHTRILDMYPPDHGAWEQIDIPRMIKVMQLGGIVSPMLWETVDKHQRCVADYLAFMIAQCKSGPGYAILDNPEYFTYDKDYKVPTTWYNTNQDPRDDIILGVPFGTDVNGACTLPNFDKHPMYGTVNYDDGSFGALYPGVYNTTMVDVGAVRFHRQVTGNRIFDINGADAMAHYGLLPDIIKKLQTRPDRVDMQAMFNSAEAYLRMLERVEKYGPGYPSRNPADWPTVDTEYWHNIK